MLGTYKNDGLVANGTGSALRFGLCFHRVLATRNRAAPSFGDLPARPGTLIGKDRGSKDHIDVRILHSGSRAQDDGDSGNHGM